MTEVNYRELWSEGEIEAKTLLDAIDALRAEVEGLRADAERYRHIRSVGGCPLDGWDSAETDDERDAVVDTARAKEAQDGR